MKKFILVLAVLFSLDNSNAQSLSPYYKVGVSDKAIPEIVKMAKTTMADNGLEILGEYAPARSSDLYVICFTNDELKNLSLQFKDRGALASILKVGLVKKDGITTISIINPEYMFMAYWGEQLKGQEEQLKRLSNKLVAMFSSFGTAEAFGGEIEKDKLPGYHYMMMMPYFTDPDELNEFGSFEEGLATIRENLDAGKGNTVKVFEQIFEGKEIAVFGVGLLDGETGEPHFLPIIGADHVANMPYEIILQGKEATALPGKYRLALYWPGLTMATFMKINSTPGEIEDVLEALTK
ncbi:MAG: hypothetical protein GXO88_06205 [Chlorobi bacterium]|nr:hypothetical protein [Chlorobiota bacterium]